MSSVDDLDEPLAAGDFAAWVRAMGDAIRGERASDVPCGTCVGCCTSSQFVHVGPDEAETLAHIPTQLLFRAPGLPRGHVLMGYDERGHCPMLVDGRCSIYEHRPRTCRTYDCRIFPASGLLPEEREKAAIARRAARWRFEVASDADRIRLDAMRAAAAFLREHASALDLPASTTAIAVLALQIHEVFLAHDARSGAIARIDPGLDAVRDAVARTRPRRSARSKR